jgi:hypothetical protein
MMLGLSLPPDRIVAQASPAMARALTCFAGPGGAPGVTATVSILDFGIFLLRIGHVEMRGKTSIGTRAKARDERATLLKLLA